MMSRALRSAARSAAARRARARRAAPRPGPRRRAGGPGDDVPRLALGLALGLLEAVAYESGDFEAHLVLDLLEEHGSSVFGV